MSLFGGVQYTGIGNDRTRAEPGRGILHWFSALVSNPRARRLFFLLAAIFTLVSILTYSGHINPDTSSWSMEDIPFIGKALRVPCSPEDYADGEWLYRPFYTRPEPLTKTYDQLDYDDTAPEGLQMNLTKAADVFIFNRFKGCASPKDFYLHLGSDKPDMWDTFPRVMNWEWVPGGKCAGNGKKAALREWNTEQVLKYLVEAGGMLLIGDSLTQSHFFTLSCQLYPHVTGSPDSPDRSTPEHLYLNPKSPLFTSDDGRPAPITIPQGWNMTSTPLISFKRVDLLFSLEQLEDMHQELHPEFYRNHTHPDSPSTFKLFSKELVFTIPAEQYLANFTSILPEGNYKTLLVSTAAHWTLTMLSGYKEPRVEDKIPDAVYGYDGLIAFFHEVMQRWATIAQEKIDNARLENPQRDQKILVRAALPGHDACHTFRSAWTKDAPVEYTIKSYSWAQFWRYNKAFEEILSDRTKYKDMYYLPLDRPGILRPDSHVTHDCLHLMSGTGVMEGWTQYIWHFLTREI